MTTYSIPTAPEVEHVWLTRAYAHVGAPPVERWTRAGVSWRAPGRELTWSELLALGTVSDVHPDLPADAPLPWTNDRGSVLDAAEALVIDAALPRGVAEFIVAAVNAYGERIATLQAELAEVLDDVRTYLDTPDLDTREAAYRGLRDRLDRA